MSHKIPYSISPVAAAVSAALAAPGAVLAQEDGASSGTLDEIIVTATKTEMNIQKIMMKIIKTLNVFLSKTIILF